ncbi:MAG: NYN domain-containing protein, partial [Cyanobacteria bacterium J06632_3]
DLAYAVDAASYKGVRVEVVSLRAMTSDSLINVSDRYIDLDTIKDDIRKTSRGNNGAPTHNYTYRPLSSLSVLDGAESARS